MTVPRTTSASTLGEMPVTAIASAVPAASPEQPDEAPADDVSRPGRDAVGHGEHDERRRPEGRDDHRVLQAQERENHEHGRRGEEALQDIVLPVEPAFLDSFRNGPSPDASAALPHRPGGIVPDAQTCKPVLIFLWLTAGGAVTINPHDPGGRPCARPDVFTAS